MISVAHLTRTFGALRALDDVSFEVEKGEVVGILGPNGAGKTTLLRILAGYLPASSGGARVAGFDVLRQSLEVRKRIGYLPESVPLYREHRVIEMLEFQARLHGLPRGDRKRRIAAALESVGLADRARDLVGNLSRGLRQRAGIAVALLPAPEVLILDEPTSGLDPLQRIEVRSLVLALAEKHTVLLSSHILPEIEAVCPRVIIIHEGRIAADGTPAELVKTLAHVAHVRVEAVVGADVARAIALLRAVPGVVEVRDQGRLGIHHQFDVVCDEDLREDVGAVAAARGWALRELSWRRPTLEQIFTRIAAPFQVPAPVLGSSVTPPANTESSPALVTLGPGVGTGGSTGGGVAPVATPSPQKVVYNLNPFDMGATRDLGKPKPTEAPKTGTSDGGPRT